MGPGCDPGRDAPATRRSYAAAPVTALVEAGFTLVATFGAPHYSVVLPAYTDPIAQRLVDVLGEVRVNPHHERRGAAVIEHDSVTVTLPADVNQIDDTGFVWAFLSNAGEPQRVQPGALIVAGDPVEPFLARVVDVLDGPNGESIVHLDVVGVPDQAIDALRHACLLPQ